MGDNDRYRSCALDCPMRQYHGRLLAKLQGTIGCRHQDLHAMERADLEALFLEVQRQRDELLTAAKEEVGLV